MYMSWEMIQINSFSLKKFQPWHIFLFGEDLQQTLLYQKLLNYHFAQKHHLQLFVTASIYLNIILYIHIKYCS